MMSQLTPVVGHVPWGVVSKARALAERPGLAGAPRGAWTVPELLEPAWNASTRPITRPSATGTASWTATRATPRPYPPRRPADRRPLRTRPPPARRSAPEGIRLDQPRGMTWEIRRST